MSDSYEFATHMWGMPPGPGGCIDASTFFRDFLETRDEVSDSMFSLGTDTDASTAREHALLGTIRALLLALLFVGMVGMGSELVLLGHYEDTVQLLPLLLLVAGLVVVLWQAVRPGAASVRVLRFVMGLFVASGLIGIVKLRPQVAEYADDEPAAQLSRIPIPLRNHQSRRLALLPFRLEFPRCRRSPCRTGYHSDV